MARLPNHVIGSAYTDPRAWEVLDDLTEVGSRMAGHDGERQGAAVVRRAFETVGLRDASVSEFGIPGWWRGSSSLEVTAGDRGRRVADHEVLALPGSPAGTVEADLVDLGTGLPADVADADVDGAVVLVSSDTPRGHDRWVHRMEKYAAAVDAGAAGFLFYNHVPGSLPPTGDVGFRKDRGEIPAAGVSAEVGDRLARYAGSGSAAVRLAVDCRTGPATSRNVEAVVGPDEGPEVLVTAHVDGHDVSDGANDNGSGCALVVEVGRLLSAVADDLDARVRLVAFGSEEVGLHGSAHWAATHDLDDVKCVVNADGVGSSRTLWVGTSVFDDVAAAFEEATAELDVPMETRDPLDPPRNAVSPYGDQWPFAQEGVPAVMVGSVSESSGRGWGHTYADTLDKLDPRDLRDLSVVVGEAVLTLADDDRELSRVPREEIRATFDEGLERELRAGDRWPYD